MKKLIFLLLMSAVLAGFAFAQDAAYPPGVFGLEAGCTEAARTAAPLTPYTVPASVLPAMAELSGFQAVTALYGNDETAILQQSGVMNASVMPLNCRQDQAASAAGNFYLRC